MKNNPSVKLLCAVIKLNKQFIVDHGGIIELNYQDNDWIEFVFGNGEKWTICYTEMDLKLIAL